MDGAKSVVCGDQKSRGNQLKRKAASANLGVMGVPAQARIEPKSPNDPADDLNVVSCRDQVQADLKQLRRDLRYGEYDRCDATQGDLLARAERLENGICFLREVGKRKTCDASLLLLKGLCTIFEVYDYHGQFKRAHDVIATEATKVVTDSKKWSPPVPGKEHGLRKQQILLLLCHAQSLYRQQEYGEALKMGRTCECLIKALFHKQGDPASATSARIYFFLGAVHRQLSEYEESRRAYTRTLKCLNENLRVITEPAAKRSEEAEDRLEQEKAVIRRSVALCFAPRGLGWLAYIRGHLQEAIAYLLAARAWLYSTNDWSNKAYTDLLIGMVHRAMAGYDPGKLRRAQAIIKGPYEEFGQRGHLVYRARAAFEFALGCLYLGELDEADRYVDEVLQLTRSCAMPDRRWESKALVIRSRIARRKRYFREAEAVATEALKIAERANQVLGEIDARIALAEAHIELGNAAVAQEHLNTALAKSKDNIATRAVCHLQLARAYLLDNNLRLADKHWSYWPKVEDRVENGVVRALAATVHSELEKRNNDFLISWADPNLNYDEHVRKLRKFLLEAARRRHGSVEKIADSLGVSRQTLYNWDE